MMEEGLRDTVLVTTYHICERCSTAIVKDSHVVNNAVHKCNRCGTADRYKNGACKYCSSVRQREWYKNSLPDEQFKKHEAREEDRELRRIAISAKRSTYRSIIPCVKCGGNVRYAKTNRCKQCSQELNALKAMSEV